MSGVAGSSRNTRVEAYREAADSNNRLLSLSCLGYSHPGGSGELEQLGGAESLEQQPVRQVRQCGSGYRTEDLWYVVCPQ